MELAETASIWETLSPWVVFAAGVAFGAVAGFWYTVWAKRPRLALESYGGNGGVPGGPWRNHLTIRLAPVRLGFQIGETRVFGRLMHRSRYWGMVTTRETARNCHAWIRKAEDKHQGAGLRWVGNDGRILDNGNLVTMEPGDRYQLALFGGESGTGPLHVLTDGQDSQLRLADQAFTESQKFVVTLLQEGGPKTRVKVRATRRFDGTWDIRAAHHWRHNQIRD